MTPAWVGAQQRWTHRRLEEQETVPTSWAESELWVGRRRVSHL